jgi:hypothetical protein
MFYQSEITLCATLYAANNEAQKCSGTIDDCKTAIGNVPIVKTLTGQDFTKYDSVTAGLSIADL